MNRILLAVALPLGLVVLSAITMPVILFGRSQRRTEIARGMSRTLSGVFDGTGDVTYSAYSYHMMLRGKKSGAHRVRFVDWINGEDGHCQRAWEWHEQHGLFDEL